MSRRFWHSPSTIHKTRKKPDPCFSIPYKEYNTECTSSTEDSPPTTNSDDFLDPTWETDDWEIKQREKQQRRRNKTLPRLKSINDIGTKKENPRQMSPKRVYLYSAYDPKMFFTDSQNKKDPSKTHKRSPRQQFSMESKKKKKKKNQRNRALTLRRRKHHKIKRKKNSDL